MTLLGQQAADGAQNNLHVTLQLLYHPHNLRSQAWKVYCIACQLADTHTKQWGTTAPAQHVNGTTHLQHQQCAD